jgi:hypothetical protein
MAKQNTLAAQRQAASNGAEDSFAIAEGVRDSFGHLAERAFAQAHAEKDPLNSIAFYRIATTAAWQAQDGKAEAYATEGVKLCQSGHNAEAPTDCALLTLIPSLASVDQETQKLNRLDARSSTPGYAPSEEDRRQAEAIYGAYRDAFDRLIEQREAAVASPVSESFVAALDGNIGKLLCRHIARSAVGELGKLDSTSERMETVSNEVSAMKCTAITAKVDPVQADCLQPRPSQCP